MKQDELFKILWEANPVVIEYFWKYGWKSKMHEYINNIRQEAKQEERQRIIGILEELKSLCFSPLDARERVVLQEAIDRISDNQ